MRDALESATDWTRSTWEELADWWRHRLNRAWTAAGVVVILASIVWDGDATIRVLGVAAALLLTLPILAGLALVAFPLIVVIGLATVPALAVGFAIVGEWWIALLLGIVSIFFPGALLRNWWAG